MSDSNQSTPINSVDNSSWAWDVRDDQFDDACDSECNWERDSRRWMALYLSGKLARLLTEVEHVKLDLDRLNILMYPATLEPIEAEDH